MKQLDLEKFDSFRGIYSEQYVKLLMQISEKTGISYEDILGKLPSSDLVKKYEEFIATYPIARVSLGIADPASYVLTVFSITSEIPKDYPEQPRYYISSSEGSVDAPFTTQEFIDSIQKEKVKKLDRK